MKKEEVYKIIEYHGIYDDKVKRNLKRIIKKYHPDKIGDNKIIQVIYEVKKELETGNISYSPLKKEEVKHNDFISKSECLKNIERLQKEKKCNDENLKKLYNELSEFLKKYTDIYNDYCFSQNSFCEVQDRIKKLKKISLNEIIIYSILAVIILINIFDYNFFSLIILIFFLIFLIMENIYRYNRFKRIKIDLNNVNNENKKLKMKIDDIQNKINLYNDKISDLERCNEKINCDIRFYKNMMN